MEKGAANIIIATLLHQVRLHSANSLKHEHIDAHWIFVEVRALPYSRFNVLPFHLRKMDRNSDGSEKQVVRVSTFPSLLEKTP